MLLEQCLQSFHMHLLNMRKSESTLKNYRVDSVQFLKFTNELLGDSLNVEFQKSDFMKVCVAYEKHINYEYKPNTANRKRSFIRSFVKFAHFREWIEYDFSESLVHLGREFAELNMVSNKSIASIEEILLKRATSATNHIHQLKDYRNFLIVLFFKEFGLKTNELLSLTWGHIHEEGDGYKIYISNKQIHPCSKELCRHINVYRTLYEKRFEHIKSEPLWTNTNMLTPHAIEAKVLERLFADLSESLMFKVTPMSFRYRSISIADKSREIVSRKAAQIGYSQPSVFIEKRNRIKR